MPVDGSTSLRTSRSDIRSANARSGPSSDCVKRRKKGRGARQDPTPGQHVDVRGKIPPRGKTNLPPCRRAFTEDDYFVGKEPWYMQRLYRD